MQVCDAMTYGLYVLYTIGLIVGLTVFGVCAGIGAAYLMEWKMAREERRRLP